MGGQIIKSISLTPKECIIIENVLPSGKFSAFVRECLHQYEASMIGEEGICRYPNKQPLEGSFCNPLHTGHKCLFCWPNGIPMKKDWLEYQRKPLLSTSGYMIIKENKKYMDHAWIQVEAEKNNPYRIDFTDFKELLVVQAKKKVKKEKVGKIRSFMKWVW